MARMSTRIKARLIVPLTLLFLVVIEEMASYQVRRAVDDAFLRTAAVVGCYGVGFALVGNRLGPYLQRAIAQGHRATRKEGGALGGFAFFGVMYAVVFFLFYVMETRGVSGLLPRRWR